MRDKIDFDRLGITDDLMFGTVFQDPNLCKGLIELLLGIEVEKIEFVERQGLLDAGNAIVIFICANDPFWPGLEALRLHAGLRSGRAALGRRHQHRVRERSGRARGLLRRIRCLPALSLE